MRAHRRVPWSDKAELGELFEFLFGEGADEASTRRGLSRMSVYISSPSCPAFLHLLHTLIHASLLPYPPASAHESQILRMAYSMAIIRFVNGMVDPLQTGPYARPISHIAASLGIPPSLIALRHRATHEDLPPLSLLHPALHQCISYIHTYSFLPTLHAPSSTTSQYQNPTGGTTGEGYQNERCERLVKSWKKIMKSRLREREVGEETEMGREIRRIKHELEGEEVEDVVAVLMGEGGLVPVAKRKRPSKTSTTPTNHSLQLWTPLITHLKIRNQSLPFTITDSILTHLIEPSSASTTNSIPPSFAYASQPTEKSSPKEDKSHKWGLAVWMIYFWTSDLTESERKDLGRRLVEALMGGDEVLQRLYKVLLGADEVFKGNFGGLERVLPATLDGKSPVNPDDEMNEDEEEEAEGEKELIGLETDQPSPAEEEVDMDMDQRLAEMEARLNNLRKKGKGTTTNIASGGVVEGISNVNTANGHGGKGVAGLEGEEGATSIGGWTRLSSEQWRVCPIGVWGAA